MGKKFSPKKNSPLYTHPNDCGDCSFLGTFEKAGKKQSYFFDLYLCDLSGVHSFVARYGNSEHEIFKKQVEAEKIPENLRKKEGR